MNEYPPLDIGCACLFCWGCNRLEVKEFMGMTFCPGSDDEEKRIDRGSETAIEQCKMVLREWIENIRF